MAGRGRPPKPTTLKIIGGNPGKRPLNKNEPKPDATAPECPAWMPKEAKAKWAELAPKLLRLGLLTEADGEEFAGLCLAWSELVVATRTLEKEGRTIRTGGTVIGDGPDAKVLGDVLRPHPAVAMQRSAWAAVRSFASLFGLDPSSRSKLSISSPPNDDPFDAFVRNGGKKKA
jgi:P27 family predicted phage terminase small subunit